jgi:glycosyltransferase involved in cell wall biosynthesis
LLPPLDEQSPREIVFFGRLQRFKGLEIFLDAVQDLDPAVALTFLGKDTAWADGQMGSARIRSRLEGRKVRLLTAANRKEALSYLAQENRLAVIPSLQETYCNAVIECAVNGIPFLASRVGGIPEIIADPELRDPLLFAPNARDLRRCLDQYLNSPLTLRRAWRDRVMTALDVRSHNKAVAAFYSDCLPQVRQSTAPPGQGPDRPVVTVAVTYYNLGTYLPDALASLARQTYPNLEVIVLDDGSTDAASLQVFEEQRRAYPQFTFRRQANSGVSAARNTCLAEGRGEFFIPFDADNIATPSLVERLVEALQRNPNWSAASCYFLAFYESADISLGKFAYAYRPTAGPHALGAIYNLFGDACSMFRTADLRAVGGYDDNRDCSSDDWEVMLKVAHAGYIRGVVPAHLFYYRHRSDSMNRGANRYRNQRRILRQYYRWDRPPAAERVELWTAWVGLLERCSHLEQLLHEQWGAWQRARTALEEQLLEQREDGQHCQAALERHLQHQREDRRRDQVELQASRARVQELERHVGELERRLAQLRFRLADRANRLLKKVPLTHRLGKGILLPSVRAWKALRRSAAVLTARRRAHP